MYVANKDYCISASIIEGKVAMHLYLQIKNDYIHKTKNVQN